MSTRFLKRTAAIAVLFGVAMAATSAFAQDNDRQRYSYNNCKDDRISSSGNAVWRPFSRDKELAGKGAAFANAVANWQREVRSKYGELWMQYDRAKGKNGDGVGRGDFDCTQASVGTFGKNIVRCTVSGSPCARKAETNETTGGNEDPKVCGYYDSSDIKQAQRLLNSCDRRECDTDVDGVLGPQTSRCLKDFQRKAGLQITGEPCRSTIEKLQAQCGGGRWRDR
jgi:Putative peptidoglycan binding domain